MYPKDELPQSGLNAHDIDYKIYGEEMQYVEVELDPQEGVIAEAGSFMMMDDGTIANWRKFVYDSILQQPDRKT